MLKTSPDRIQWFIETYGSSGFQHAEELVPIMRRNDPDESKISCHEMQLAEYLRRIYRRRAKHLAESPPSPFYPPSLAADVRALADRFDSARDQPVRIWDTALPSGTVYAAWELVDDQEIAGCVKSADQRIVNPQTW